MERKIVTDNIFPPIPIRRFDWVAIYDGDEEGGPRGYGPTEQEAIADLRASFPDDGADDAVEACSHCGASTPEEISLRCTINGAALVAGMPCHGEYPR